MRKIMGLLLGGLFFSVVGFGMQDLHAQSADTVASCASSYDAVYKPSSENPDYQGYTLTISPVEQEEWLANNLDEIKVIKVDDKGSPLYEIRLVYACNGGSFPSCSVSATTRHGKNIEITPAGLNKDFSYNRFFIRDDSPVPYVLIFSGADQKFYYLGDELDEKSLKYKTKEKPIINKFPVVWFLDTCNSILP